MLEELAAAMLRYTDRHVGNNPYTTPIDSLIVMRSDHPKPPTHYMARPAMCIVAQGAKWATFERQNWNTRLEKHW